MARKPDVFQSLDNAKIRLFAGKEFLRWYEQKAIDRALPGVEQLHASLASQKVAPPDYLGKVAPKSWSDVANAETRMALQNIDKMALRSQHAFNWGHKHPVALQRFEPNTHTEIKHARHGRAFVVQQFIARLKEAMGPKACAAAQAGIDVGCGTGRTTRLLAEAFGAVTMTGVDACSEALAWGAAHRTFADARIQWQHALAEKLPVANNTQDFITALWVFDDMPHEAQQQALGEAWRALKPGGTLALLGRGTPQGLHTFCDSKAMIVSGGYTALTARKPTFM